MLPLCLKMYSGPHKTYAPAAKAAPTTHRPAVVVDTSMTSRVCAGVAKLYLKPISPMDRTRHSRDRDRDREKEREKGRLRDTEDKHREKDDGSQRGRWKEKERSGEERKRASKNPTRDHHRRHLEKLMEHPVRLCLSALSLYEVARIYIQEKPVDIPESTKDKKPKDPPDFVRFYMGQCLVVHY